MDVRTINEKYAKIGADLIKTEPSLRDLAISNAQVVFLSSEYKKKNGTKITHAECEKIADRYKWGIPADFTITVFEPNIEGFSDEQIRILLFHELLHIRIDTDGNGVESYGIYPHDLEDFKEIVDRFGTDWSKVDGITD